MGSNILYIQSEYSKFFKKTFVVAYLTCAADYTSLILLFILGEAKKLFCFVFLKT